MLIILFNCTLEAWEIVNKVHEALMLYDVRVPFIEVLSHPRVRIGTAIGVSTNVSVH